MITLFLLMPVVVLFMITNIIVGCYLMIWLGYGPPNWQTALNLVVRVTTFQDRLNEGRNWLDKKAPWADKYFTRLHVPKPIIIVDTSVAEETDDEEPDEPIDERVDALPEDLPTEEPSESQSLETEPAPDETANGEKMPLGQPRIEPTGVGTSGS